MFEKEAEEYANRCACLMEDIPIIERAYRTGAEFGYNKAKEELEKDNNRLFLEGAKRVEDLEAQIEKMKCCENCKHSDTECEGHTICHKGHFFDCLSNKIFDHTSEEKDYWEKDYWEIKENDL